jgi:putative selenate reductase
VEVDAATRSAGPDGVFAGGDVVIEPGSIIAACADGRKAAEAIAARLGLAFTQPSARPAVLSERDIIDVKAVRARRIAREVPAARPVEARGGFEQIESTLTAVQARVEGLRCVQCTAFCDKCVEVCPNRANYTFRVRPVRWELPLIAGGEAGLRVAGTEEFRVVQDRQILHVDDFCNDCDNCQTFCVHHGRPYADKPRLFLDADAFAAEESNAFHVEGRTIRRRERGVSCTLTVREDSLYYDDEALRIDMTRDWRITKMTAKVPVDGTRSLRPAAEMVVLFEGIRNTLPYLLIR